MMRCIYIFCLLVALCGQPLQALLDGTASSVYCGSTYVFSHGESAVGKVFLTQGFTVTAGATIYLGINQPVSGPINLNKTGRIVLTDTLILGLNSTGFVNGGILTTPDGSQGIVSFNSHTDITQQIVLQSSMRFDLNGYSLRLRSDGSNRGAFMIDNSLSQTLMLRNGYLRGVEDFATGFAPRLRANTPIGGRHGYYLKDIKAQFLRDGTMTGTGYDLIFKGFNNSIECIRQSLVLLGKGLYVEDMSQIVLNAGVELRLDTTLSASYFAMGHGSSLALRDAIFSYTKPISIPSPYLAKNMIATLSAQQGSCVVRALGAGGNTMLTLGGSLDYDYDPFIDIFPSATLQFDNVALINQSSNSGR
jgi:hypothetical protein